MAVEKAIEPHKLMVPLGTGPSTQALQACRQPCVGELGRRTILCPAVVAPSKSRAGSGSQYLSVRTRSHYVSHGPVIAACSFRRAVALKKRKKLLGEQSTTHARICAVHAHSHSEKLPNSREMIVGCRLDSANAQHPSKTSLCGATGKAGHCSSGSGETVQIATLVDASEKNTLLDAGEARRPKVLPDSRSGAR
jgi:hypothetical protein